MQICTFYLLVVFASIVLHRAQEKLVAHCIMTIKGIHSLLHYFSFSGEVLMPSGKSAQPLITDNLDGTVTVQYSPTEAGLHEMHIKYNGTHIPGQHTQP